MQSIPHSSAPVEIKCRTDIEAVNMDVTLLSVESCQQLEAISKYEAELSHGDFRRFFYKATVNSMPKNRKLDGTGREGLFSEIKAQFKTFNSVSDEQNRPSFYQQGLRTTSASKHSICCEKGRKNWPNRKTAQSETRSRRQQEVALLLYDRIMLSVSSYSGFWNNRYNSPSRCVPVEKGHRGCFDCLLTVSGTTLKRLKRTLTGERSSYNGIGETSRTPKAFQWMIIS